MKTTFFVSFSTLLFVIFDSWKSHELSLQLSSLFLIIYNRNWIEKVVWKQGKLMSKLQKSGKNTRPWNTWLQLAYSRVAFSLLWMWHHFNSYFLDDGGQASSCAKHTNYSPLSDLLNVSRIISFGALWTEKWPKYL